MLRYSRKASPARRRAERADYLAGWTFGAQLIASGALRTAAASWGYPDHAGAALRCISNLSRPDATGVQLYSLAERQGTRDALRAGFGID